MKTPSIDDLAERADDRGDGYFFVCRHGKDDEPSAGAWVVGMRKYGKTYAEACQDLLDQQEALGA